MATPINLKADIAAFKKRVKQLADNTPYNSRQVLRNECRLMLEDIVALTKPKKKGKMNAAIAGAANKIFQGVKNASGEPKKAEYNKYRFRLRKKAGLPTGKNPILVNAVALRQFIKREQERVGQFAASWLGNNNPLRAKRGVPSYVLRHIAKAEGSTQINDGPLKTSITVKNRNHLLDMMGGFERSMLSLMKRAIQVRTGKTIKTLKNLLKYGGEYKMPKAK